MTLVLTFLAFSRRVGARENLPTFIAVIGEEPVHNVEKKTGSMGCANMPGRAGTIP